jgi:hypothetical protein
MTVGVKQGLHRVNDLPQKTNAACADRLARFVAKNGRNVAYFIGSGLSLPAYPTWIELTQKIAEYFAMHGRPLPNVSQFPTVTPHDLQAIFQRYRDHNPELYVNFIREIFEQPPLTHQDSLFKILRQQPQLIVTLNFDLAIQAAAQVCDIKITTRFFPKFTHIAQERGGVPVVFHLHGKYHDALHADPDRLILHTSAYRRYYEDGDKPIKGRYAEIFLSRNVVFVGTALEEPEMAEFFRAYNSCMADSSTRPEHLALLPTEADELHDGQRTPNDILQMEQSKDATLQSETGIERVRFFKRGKKFLGLNEILSAAFGERTLVREPEPFYFQGGKANGL